MMNFKNVEEFRSCLEKELLSHGDYGSLGEFRKLGRVRTDVDTVITQCLHYIEEEGENIDGFSCTGYLKGCAVTTLFRKEDDGVVVSCSVR